METVKNKRVLISGASFAGLSVAYWMRSFGYDVTVIEIASGIKIGGTPVNIEGDTVEIVRRMGLLEEIRSQRLVMELFEFKNDHDETEGTIVVKKEGEPLSEDAFEIDRTTLLNMLFERVKNGVTFVFNNGIRTLNERDDAMAVVFNDGSEHSFDLVFGCDGIHSAVRKIWFGAEHEYMHFLGQYFSISIVDKLLVKPFTTQFYNVPDKGVMLNSYQDKTDIVFCFRSEDEIPYDYRDEEQQRNIIMAQFEGLGWRTAELLEEAMNFKAFYFDKLCQIRMPSWTKGRVALIGDAGYCASPAAGKGGSLAIDGAAALADAFYQCRGDYELAFKAYNTNFRPFIEATQAYVVEVGLDILLPRSEEAIRKRNTEGLGF